MLLKGDFYMSEQYRCGICHASVIPNKEIEISKKTKTYLDFIPKENPIEYIDSRLEFCDNCGFVNYKINRMFEEETEEQIKKILWSKEYNDIACNNSMNPTERKLLLANILHRKLKIIPSINFFLFEYYDLTNEPQKAKDYALKEIERLKKNVNIILNNKEQDVIGNLFESICENYKIIELYRRLSEFEQAQQVINMYKNFSFSAHSNVFKFIGKNYKKLFSIQNRLCGKKENCRL